MGGQPNLGNACILGTYGPAALPLQENAIVNSHFMAGHLHPDGTNGDPTLLKEFSQVCLPELHRIVPNIDLMLCSCRAPTFTRPQGDQDKSSQKERFQDCGIRKCKSKTAPGIKIKTNAELLQSTQSIPRKQINTRLGKKRSKNSSIIKSQYYLPLPSLSLPSLLSLLLLL